MNPKVDAYIGRSTKWPAEMRELRSILLACGLTEEIKWGKPCYSCDDHNIAIIQEMKEFLSLMFFKGALLTDPKGVLRSQGPNSRSALRLELLSVDDVAAHADVIRSYVGEAIAIEDLGLRVAPAPAVALVDELQHRIDTDAAFKDAFSALTPGRQREYNMYLAQAKQASTRLARIEKFEANIFAGKGMRE